MGSGTKYHSNMNVIYGYHSHCNQEFIWNNLQREITLMLMCSVTMKFALASASWLPYVPLVMCRSFSVPNLKADLFWITPIPSVVLPQKWHKHFLQFQNSISISKVYFHFTSLVCLPGHLKMILMGNLIQKWSHCSCPCYFYRTFEHFINGK